MTYLDYQATTPLAPEAFDAMLPWLRDGHANPHSAHREGRRAKAAIEIARDEVARLLPPGGRVVFTSGATEALNWAIKGSAGPIVTLATEHAAVLDTVAAEARRGRTVTVLPVGEDGLVDLGRARDAIPPGTGLVAAMLVNNEIGVLQPIAALADLAHAAGALFLGDAVQGYGRVAVPANVDLVAVSAHKVHGPKGVGALWIRDSVALEPLLHGGDQENGRSGTLSPALCAGFGTAARLMRERADEDRAHVERLWRIATEPLGLQVPLPHGVPAKVLLWREPSGGARGGDVTRKDVTSPPSDPVNHAPGMVQKRPGDVSAGSLPPANGRGGRHGGSWILNGSPTHRYHGNLNIRRAGLDVARLMSDLRDLAFSAGSACASGSGRPSHVLRAVSLTDAQARSSIRLGFGRYTTEAELAEALDRVDLAARAQRA